MIRNLARTLALILASTLLTACATLPNLAQNQLGPQIETGNANETLYYSPSGPSDKASPEQIISGFLYAGNGPQEDYAVAREYLTASFAAKWKPAVETLIQSGETRIISNTGTKIRLEVPFDARVAQDGTYESTPGSTRVIEFRLLQVFGNWRIASAPNLTILLRPNFGLLFQPVSVFFWDQTLTHLVPEIRWFPTKAALATRITNAMIAGPSPWLDPVVQNLLPNGTKLNINSVTVTAGNALVDLNSSALKIPAWKRPYLRSQLIATLGEVEGITDVTVSIERTVQEITNGSSGISESPSNLPVVLTRDGLFHIAGSNTFEINDTQSLVQEIAATGFAISVDESFVALLGKDAVHTYTLGLIGVKDKLIDQRPKLLAPTIDPYDQVWTASFKKGAEIRVIDKRGNVVSIPNPYGFGTAIRGISMSPEGSRLAIVHDYYNGSTVDILPVIRDKSRKVTGLAQPFQLSQFGKSTQTITWVDRVTVAGLVRDQQGSQSMLTALVGGASTIGRITENGLALASAIGGNHYYLDSNGDLFVSKTFGWEKSIGQVLAMRMAGQ
ncbi:MAG: hypothetical protein RLZZ380_466 [Actinomycetota bacterium]|jgi:hypothetical protein